MQEWPDFKGRSNQLFVLISGLYSESILYISCAIFAYVNSVKLKKWRGFKIYPVKIDPVTVSHGSTGPCWFDLQFLEVSLFVLWVCHHTVHKSDKAVWQKVIYLLWNDYTWMGFELCQLSQLIAKLPNGRRGTISVFEETAHFTWTLSHPKMLT